MPQPEKFLLSSFLDQDKFKRRPKNAGRLYEITHLNKYAWWLEDKGRRETPAETWERVTNYSLSLYEGPASKEDLLKEAELMYEKMYNLEVAPAGRTMRIGGTAACYKFPEMNFNCSYVTVDDIQALTDSFHMSLCSVGLGYRVLIEDVAKLEGFCQEVLVDHEDYIHDSSRDEYTSNEFLGYQGKYPLYRLTVGDSKEGWVEALRIFLLMSHAHSFDHNGIRWVINYNFIRPEGERIKTAGGFAAGHRGMQEMFTRLGATLTKKKGVLNPVAAMDSQNIVGKNVVTGGNRRSAQIALGSPEDQEFVEAKKNLYTKMDDGSWKIPFELEHRKMSNNSVVFQKKPSWEELCNLFETIKNNGEPGFFNLEAAKVRRPNVCGLNPCLTADTWINTVEGPRQIKDLRDKPYKAMINGVSKDATFFWSSGVKPVYRLSTREGYSLKLTADHKVLTKDGWKEAKDLTTKDLIILNNTYSDPHEWEGDGTFKEGWLIGSLVGDGTYSQGKVTDNAQLRYWGEDREILATQAFEFLKDSVELRPNMKIGNYKNRPYSQVQTVELTKLAQRFGIVMGAKVNITPQIEKASSKFYEGFLQGLFDADGSPQGSIAKGRSIRLWQANAEFLHGIQRMLARLGIKSTVYDCRKEEGIHIMPDGKGGSKGFLCKQGSELIISRSSMYRYAERIGFSEPKKLAKLADIVGTHNTRRLYTDKFEVSFKSLEFIGEEEVFDCTVQDLHRFDANGIIVHNCAEILLDSKGVCNLSTVIMTSHLTEPNEDGERWVDFEKLEESVRLATRIGLRQTNVTLSLPEWDKVQKRDRLTGVSYTGMEDMLDRLPTWFRRDHYPLMLQLMGKWANDEADKYAYEMRVPRPLLVTAVKPEGCWTKEFLRTTDQGLLFIDELSPEIERTLGFSEVEGFSSQGNKILKCFNKGKADIIAITLLNKRLLKVTPEHPLAVSTGKNKEEWIKAKDLKKGMKISYRLGTYTRTEEGALAGIEGTTQERAYTLPEKMSPDLAWLLGLYWGDGSFTTYDRIKLIGSELDIHLKAQRIWKDLFGVETNIIKCSDREAYTQDFRATKIRRWLDLNGLEKTSYEYFSRIPRLIRESSRDSIIAFIAGLSDADGCYYNKSMCIDNKSDVFIRHLQEVGEAVGISFSFITNSKRNSFSKNSIYKCHLSRIETTEEAAELLNRYSVKASITPVVPIPCTDSGCKAYRHKRYMITDISQLVEQEEAYDIEVEGSHWYYQGGLKSHNTISQLPTCSSGLHRAFAPYYIRRMSVTKNDPLNAALKELGVAWEEDRREKESTREIFLFPIETGAQISAYEEPAIDQLKRYFLNQKFYTDHNSSCTIYVGSGYDGYDDEWDEIIEAVWENWDQMVAVSFLPKHSLENPPFPQMPYEWTSKENYDKMMETFPDLSKLGEVVARYEKERTEFYEYSDGCAGGVCPTA